MALSKPWLRAIALNELLGAALIAAVWVLAVIKPFPLTPLYLLTSTLTFVTCTLAGILLLRLHPLGRRLSLVLQLLQIVGITTSGVTLRLELGTKITAELNSYRFSTHWGFNGLVAIGPSPGVDWSVTVNFLALVALLYLLKYRQVPKPQGAPSAVAA